MAKFRELFVFKAAGADGTQRETREGEVTITTFAAAADAQGAARAAAELKTGDGLDLVELFGGFGAETAKAVFEATGGEVPVGLTGARERDAAGDQAVIFASPGADPDPAKDRYVYDSEGTRMTIVAMPGADGSVAAARQLIDEGIERIELCGGHGALPAAAVSAAVGERVPVDAVLFGFESMDGVAAYKARFAEAMAS